TGGLHATSGGATLRARRPVRGSCVGTSRAEGVGDHRAPLEDDVRAAADAVVHGRIRLRVHRARPFGVHVAPGAGPHLRTRVAVYHRSVDLTVTGVGSAADFGALAGVRHHAYLGVDRAAGLPGVEGPGVEGPGVGVAGAGAAGAGAAGA